MLVMTNLKRLLFCSVAGALVFGSPMAFAETKEVTREYKKSPSISGSGQIRPFNFWGNSWGRSWRSRTRYRSYGELPATPKKTNPYHTYVPDRLTTLADRATKQPAGDKPVFATEAPADFDPTPASLRSTKLDDSLAQTIFDLIKAGETGIRVTKAYKKAILSYYHDRGYKAAWATLDGLEERAKGVVQLLKDADAEGLDAGDYRLPVLEQYDNDLELIERDLVAIARFDIQLTAMAVRYARHASGGRIVANRISDYHDLKPSIVAPETALRELAENSEPSVYLASLHPQHAAYPQFKAALAEQRANPEPTDIVTPIPPGPTIVPGQSDDRIPDIRYRLIKNGHLEARDVSIIPSSGEEFVDSSTAVVEENTDGLLAPNETAYEGELVEAVKKFQRSAGLKPDGLIGKRTISALNGDVQKHFDKTARIVANMERLRWLPRDLGRSHIFVNQASFRLKLVKNGRQVWTTKVIVGKPENQTSFFSDEMETVVFNPYWGVPQSIIINEMIPKLVNDPGYLDRLGYEVYTGRGYRVSSYDIDWWDYYSQEPVAVRQPPGRENALGQLKFLFPNKHAIYLHDTPTKNLFNRDQRAFSHGCVRIQNPRELAEAILGWNQSRIASHISTGQNQKVSLNRKLPVHLTYFTAWPGPDGKVNYFNDMYGRDARLELAFAATTAAFR